MRPLSLTGQVLVLTGFAAGCLLDLCIGHPVAWLHGDAIPARNSATIVIVLGLLLAHLGARMEDAGPGQYSCVVWVLGAGGVTYAIGSALVVLSPVGWGLQIAGTLLLMGGVAGYGRMEGSGEWRIALVVIAAGMAMDIVNGAQHLGVSRLITSYLGSETDLRLRMLRLARIAALALPLLVLELKGVEINVADGGSGRRRALERWAGIALLCGAAGLPAGLLAAGCVSASLKYLLPLPADAVFAGVVIAAVLSHRHGCRLEAQGWSLIAGAISVGLLLGTFAFQGPLHPPPAFGDYALLPRQLVRQAHTYAILLGMLFIRVSREPGSGNTRNVVILLRSGALATIGGLILRASVPLPAAGLAVGPLLVTAAIALWIGNGIAAGFAKSPISPKNC